MSKPHHGVIGLAVMGSNLARNIESRGLPVAVFNRSGDVTDEFMKAQKGKKFVASKTLQEFVASMTEPRQILVMVKAGKPVDDLLDTLLPLLSKGDIVMDGGNSFYLDTNRREARCSAVGIRYLGVGVSGGEKGALTGPSIMPGGTRDAWQFVEPMFKKIAAVAGDPCVAYIGPGGAGHFVKMVHNGIEYGDMQLIAEAYDALQQLTQATPHDLARIFTAWNEGVLQSFLIEITAKIFAYKEGDDYLVNKIRDAAGQKGTGRWTAEVALQLGVSVPTLAAAVDARVLSSMKSEREHAANEFKAPTIDSCNDREGQIHDIHDALYCAKILSYAQGMALLRSASNEFKWELRLNEIAALWKGGCIIRARFLDDIKKAYESNPALNNLILDPFMKKEVSRTVPALRRLVAKCATSGIPLPCFSASLAYFESYTKARLPQNLTQAQRDLFGSHTYERLDKQGVFHTEWEG